LARKAEKENWFSGTYKSGAELEGFRGINWGANLSMLSEMVPSESDSSSSKINPYLRNGDELTNGAASLERIEYGFWKGRVKRRIGILFVFLR
jgi:hypothetical protein